MRYYISDLHFYHESLNDHMDCRGFASAEAMNEYMIRQWNSRVRSGDDVVILGDFCVAKTGQEANEILARLKGKKYLIKGNHDYFLKKQDFNSQLFQWIEPYKEMKDKKRRVVLSHYPIMCYNGQYSRDAGGNPKVYMLYGHVHNTYDEVLVNSFQNQTRQSQRLVRGIDKMQNIPCQMINCFCMFSDYVPLTLDEWIQVDQKRRENMAGSEFGIAEK